MRFIFLATSIFLASLGWLIPDIDVSSWCLIVSQLLLFGWIVFEKNLTGVGAFLFMSVQFFALRPAYMMVEGDRALFGRLFGLDITDDVIHRNLTWATAGIFAFFGGAMLMRRWLGTRAAQREEEGRNDVLVLPPDQFTPILIGLQVLAIIAILPLARAWHGTIYESVWGAYYYDMPQFLQGIHIFVLVVLLERYMRERTQLRLVQLGISGAIFLYYTVMMRDMSNFRGFYLTGVMVAGIGMIARFRGRVGYAWLVIPIVVLLPAFKQLGVLRAETTSVVSGVFQEQKHEIFSLASYWTAYDSQGDINIFDTYVAASEAQTAFKPYLWSWLYVPLHIVPRKYWEGKPKSGITQDTSFARGAPYSPGIAGFFVLDGGRLWMLGSMLVLGMIVAWLDVLHVGMRAGYLRYCVHGIFVINAMFLTRFFLWQYAYQVLYALVPCIILNKLMGRTITVKEKEAAALETMQETLAVTRKQIRGVSRTGEGALGLPMPAGSGSAQAALKPGKVRGRAVGAIGTPTAGRGGG